MARNTSSGSRKGAVSSRSQVFNPSTGNYVKRDSNTGQFLAVKVDGKPFKGVAKEKSAVKSNPSVKKATAKKAENAVIAIVNRSKGTVTITIKTTGKKTTPKKTSVKKAQPKKAVAKRKIAVKKTTAKAKTATPKTKRKK